MAQGQSAKSARKYGVDVPASFSRELNPVEHIWDSIWENDFSKAVFNSIEAVEDPLARFLAAPRKNLSDVTSMTGVPPINRINVDVI